MTFGGDTWRDGEPQTVFDVFGVMRQLQEMAWYLTEARVLQPGPDVDGCLARVRTLTGGTAAEVLDVDVPALRHQVGTVLERVSATVRAAYPGASDRRGAELFGADLTGADLRGSTMRGAYLIGANLSRADLRHADLLGADLRDADLRGAELSTSLFLTTAQLRSARTDPSTRMPPHIIG